MQQLKNRYIATGTDIRQSYGGNQMKSASVTMREAGCGVVAALDLLLYLSRTREDCSSTFFDSALGDGVIDEKEYDALLRTLSRRFFPIVPKIGITGIGLAAGLNLFFLRYRFPLRASWCISGKTLWDETERMLRDNIPVILSVGPNFPFFWRNNKMKLYSFRPDGTEAGSVSINAHYVTVTAIDEEKIRISSWGREFTILRSDYEDYVRRYSSPVTSNIVKIRLK